MSVLAAVRREEYDKGTSRGSEMKQYQSHRHVCVPSMQRDFLRIVDLTRPLYGLLSSQTIGLFPLRSFHLAQEKGCFSVADCRSIDDRRPESGRVTCFESGTGVERAWLKGRRA